MIAMEIEMPPLVLASASTGRAAILRNAGLSFQQRASDIDERQLEEALREKNRGAAPDPAELARSLASAKSVAVSTQFPDAIVIGADQVMFAAGAVMHKPQDLDGARRQLMTLRGASHSLHSAVSVAQAGSVLWTHADRAELTMREFSDAFLDEYCTLEGGRLLASVGCYHIEGRGIQLFSGIKGEIFTIIGLPLLPLLGYLRELGAAAR